MKKKQLEGIRGIAILLVITYHIFYRFQEIYCDSVREIFGMSYWGKIGVIFFLLMSMIFVFAHEEQNATQFLIRRFFRLWPTYFVAITLTFIVTSSWGLDGRTVELKDYIANVLLINHFIGLPYVDSAHWYLTTMVAASIICTILIATKQTERAEVYFIWMVVTVCFGKIIKIPILYTILGGNYVGILILGIQFGRYLRKKEIGSRDIFVSGIAIFYVAVAQGLIDMGIMVMAIFILLLAWNNKLKLLECKKLLYIARISYPLYLIHQNISYCIEIALIKHMNLFFAGTICIIISLTLATILYYSVEKPVAKFVKSRLGKALIS